MSRRSLIRFCLVSVGLCLAVSLLSAQSGRKPRKLKVPPPSARIEVVVVRDVNGKPIENASVIFHPLEGDRDRGGMELKTNEEGKAVIDVIPLGDTVRMQVIARGFVTSGQDFKVDKEELNFEIRMKRPGGQYSIYKNSAQTTTTPQTPAPMSGAATDTPAAKSPETPKK